MRTLNEAKASAKAQGLKVYVGNACKKGHDGLRYVNNNSCVQCMSERQKTPQAKATKAKHYQSNRTIYLNKSAKSYEANRDSRIAYACERQRNMLVAIAEKRKQRMQTDPLFAIKERVRGLIRECLKKQGHKKQSRTVDILGCSIDDFKLHIERQFLPGMTWENRGDWEIDHITPISTATTESELLQLNHFTNMRPLWREANRSKSAKVLFLI